MKQKEENPIIYSLNKIPWGLFGTITWADDFKQGNTDKAAYFRRGDCFNYFGCVCSDVGLHSRDLGIYLNEEGHEDDHTHAHFLIAKKCLSGNAIAELATSLRHNWRHGRAEIELFDECRRGIEYVTKSQPQNEFISPALRRLLKASNNKIQLN